MLTLHTVFVVCALLGGTVVVCQFLLTLLGMGTDTEFADDLPEEVDLSGADYSGWLFGILSFRTLVAATAFFGLGGWAAHANGSSIAIQLLVAVACGAAAMYGVHSIMRLLSRLGHDGTIRVSGAVGKTGTVYVPIPAKRTGVGKIQIKLQNRIMEYPAMTSSDEKLPTGAKVVVVSVLESTTLEVEPIREAAPSSVAGTAPMIGS